MGCGLRENCESLQLISGTINLPRLPPLATLGVNFIAPHIQKKSYIFNRIPYKTQTERKSVATLALQHRKANLRKKLLLVP